jgi:upstream activation factor subunit UAF30
MLSHVLTRETVPPEVRANYIATIDSILAASNIEEVSEKRIRKGIQDSVQYDITPQKVRILEAQ